MNKQFNVNIKKCDDIDERIYDMLTDESFFESLEGGKNDIDDDIYNMLIDTSFLDF